MKACDGSAAGGAAASKVSHAAKHAANRTASGVAAVARPDGLAFNAVLLCSEGECDVVCGGKEVEWIGCCVENSTAPSEGDVAEAERCGIVVRACIAVFSGPQEKEKADPDDVRETLGAGVPTVVLAEDVVEDWCGEGLNSRWRRILSCVAAKLAR